MQEPVNDVRALPHAATYLCHEEIMALRTCTSLQPASVLLPARLNESILKATWTAHFLDFVFIRFELNAVHTAVEEQIQA